MEIHPDAPANPLYHDLKELLDYDRDESKKYPVLLYTPNMDRTEDHFHIVLTKKEAKSLRDWLDNYLD